MSPPTATYIGSSRRRYGDAHGCRWGVPVVIAQPNHRRRNGRPVPLTVDPMPCSCMRSIPLIGIQTAEDVSSEPATAPQSSSSLSPVLSLHVRTRRMRPCRDVSIDISGQPRCTYPVSRWRLNHLLVARIGRAHV